VRRQLRWPRAHYKRCAASNCGFCPSFRHAAQLRWPRAHCKRCAASNCGIRPSFRHAAQLRWPRAQYKHGTASTCKCIIFAPLFALCINLQLNYEGQEHITRMVQPMSVPTPPSPSHPAACTPNPNLNTIPSTPVGDFSSTHHHHHHHQQQQQQQQEQQQQRQQQEPSPLQQQQQQQQEGVVSRLVPPPDFGDVRYKLMARYRSQSAAQRLILGRKVGVFCKCICNIIMCVFVCVCVSCVSI